MLLFDGWSKLVMSTSGLDWFVYSYSDMQECSILPIKCFSLLLFAQIVLLAPDPFPTAKDRLGKYVGIYILDNLVTSTGLQ